VFKDNDAFSGFSVDDIDAAEKFYGETLGLKVERNAMGNLDIRLGTGAMVMAYPKQNHEPATFTILNFLVPDIDAAVDGLVAAGVKMQEYDEPQMKTDAKGIIRNDFGPPIAWFTDPAGNIISVIETSSGG
jgi:predicted enzyme related to lactoylglutathione lyase